MDQTSLVVTWNPYGVVVTTLKDIHGWVDRYGERAFYNGRFWRLKTKRICPGRYRVSFEED